MRVNSVYMCVVGDMYVRGRGGKGKRARMNMCAGGVCRALWEEGGTWKKEAYVQRR